MPHRILATVVMLLLVTAFRGPETDTEHEPEHHGAALADAAIEAVEFRRQLVDSDLGSKLSHAVADRVRSDCPARALLSAAQVERRLVHGASSTLVWASLAPFGGEWTGTWGNLEVNHAWYPARRRGLPALDAGQLVASQYAWVGDGYGWNIEVATSDGARHLLGSVTHLSDERDPYRVPHVGIPGGDGEIAWIVPGRLYLERAVPAASSYEIREYTWSLDGAHVVVEHQNAATYRRPLH